MCEDIYGVQEEDAFRRNEWELISLESAEGDNEWKSVIIEFWNHHLQILMYIKGGYSYYAISMKNGSIVQGSAPELEECEMVADSLREFVKKIISKEIIL